MGPFKIALIVLFLEVFVPGYLVLRSLRFPRQWAVCCGPVVSVGVIAVWCQILAFAGIFASPLTVFAPICAAAALVFLVFSRKRETLALPDLRWVEVLLYLVIGVALGYELYVTYLPHGDYVYTLYDVTQHLNLTTAFAQSGHMSSLGTSAYLTPQDMAIDPVPYEAFYPAAYHTMCALLTQAIGCTAPVSINAATVVFCFMAYPLGMLAFLAAAFPGKSHVRVAGALSALAVLSFPWIVMMWGPIYPNLAAMGLLPAAMAIFIALLTCARERLDWVSLGLALLIAVVAEALLHPNGVFAAIVFLVPFCITLLWRLPQTSQLDLPKRLVPPVLFAVLVACLWYGCYKLPFFQGIVWENWPAYTHASQALVNIVTLNYDFGHAQFEYTTQLIPAVLVLVGLVTTLHDSDHRWLGVTYLTWCVFLYLAITTDGTLKHVLTGFWYTDSMRLAAFAAIAAVVLLAQGLVWVFEQAQALVERYNEGKSKTTHPAKIAVVLGACFLALNYMPGFELPARSEADEPREFRYVSDGDISLAWQMHYPEVRTSFGDWRLAVTEQNTYQIPYTNPERAFAARTAKITGDALVINDPMDGSYLAYSVNGVRCYYRDFIGVGGDNETEASRQIRLHLNEISTNPDVRAAVNQVGAQYVMKLNMWWSDLSPINLRGGFKPENFAGIWAVNDSTPGFEKVLEAPNCVLYRILPE